MSMGGATVHDCGESCKGKYRFDSADQANKTAKKMHDLFFSGTDNERPFGDVQLDGVDLDIGKSLPRLPLICILNEVTSTEDPGKQYFYDMFVERLRELQCPKDLIVSAAPECHHGCSSNCNALEQTVKFTAFDYLL